MAQSHSNLTTVGISEGRPTSAGRSAEAVAFEPLSVFPNPTSSPAYKTPESTSTTPISMAPLPSTSTATPSLHGLQLLSRVIVIGFRRRITGRRPPGLRDQLACLLRILFPH